MQSSAKVIAAYIAEAPPERQECLRALRAVCLELLVGYEENMQYGMASYAKGGVVEIAFASQKNYISLYGLKQKVLEANRELFAGLDCGKGCIRYSRPEKVNLEAVRKLLTDTVALPETAC